MGRQQAPMWRRAGSVALLVALPCACSQSSSVAPDSGVEGDTGAAVVDARRDTTGSDGAVPDARVHDAAAPPDTAGTDAAPDGAGAPDAGLPRGLAWVRDNPMFISALTVNMGPPTATAVSTYLNQFHANAVHLWMDGLPQAMDGWRANGPAGMRWLSWVKQDGTSTKSSQVIGGYGPNVAGRVGYQVHDEPGDLQALKSLAVGVNAVRGADPDALIVVNFSHAATGLATMLDHYGTAMDGDVVSMDTYSLSNKTYERLDIFRKAGLKHNMPYWRYIVSYDDVGDPKGLEASDLRWHALLGLVFGYTGHTWFLYQIDKNNQQLLPVLFVEKGIFDGTPTALFTVAAQLNVEMANLGLAITQLTSTAVCYVPSVPFFQPANIPGCSTVYGVDPYLAKVGPAPGQLLLDAFVGLFKDDAGETYVMVQNPRHAGGSWPVDNDDAGTFRLDFDFSSAAASVSRQQLLVLNKLTAKVEPLALTATGPNTASVDVTLDAGDVLLFKYDTGVGFALQGAP